LTGTDFVRFKPPGAHRSLCGYVLATEGTERNAEIEGDTVRVQAEHGSRVYIVPRSDVEALHGKVLDKAKATKDKPRRPLRSKRTKRHGAPFFRTLIASPPSEIARLGAPTPLGIVKCGPAQLAPVPKEIPAVRSDAYRNFVRPVEAHHEGAHPLARADGYHKYYTDENRLPCRTGEESLCLMEVAQRVLLVEFIRRMLHLLVPVTEAEQPNLEEQRFYDALISEEEPYLCALGGGR
jgi:hypothetical protein